jgi:acetyl esterase
MNQAIANFDVGATLTPGVLPVSSLDPAAQSFLGALARNGGSSSFESSVEEGRAAFAKAQSGYVAKLPVDIEDRTVLIGPRGNIAIRIIRPKGNTTTLPAVMYFHGGGWVLGDAETHDRLVREIAHGANAAVIFVEYARAPEARYPVALEEAYAATCWAARVATIINVDPRRIAVAGDGAGGNLAAAVTMLAKQRGGPRLCFQVLFYPITIAKFDSESYGQFAENHHLTREGMKWFWNHYAQTTAAREQPTASPLRASVEQLRGLPPALVVTAECDVLRDEGEAYALKLEEAGGAVAATRYPGMIHDFVMLNALAETPAARGAIAQANSLLRKAFSSSP